MIDEKRLLGMLGIATKAGKITFGAESCKEAIMKNKIKLLLLAKDASERTKTKFEVLAHSKKVPVFEVSNIEEMSRAIGKKNKAVVGILDFNFSKAIIEIINGGGEF